MEYNLTNTLHNMDWLNPFDYWDLIMSIASIFAAFQGKIQKQFILFYENGFKYGNQILPHHHPVLMSPITLIYFTIFISILIILGFIVGLTLCIANIFPSWILLALVYIIFWRNPKLLTLDTITAFSVFWVVAYFFGWF